MSRTDDAARRAGDARAASIIATAVARLSALFPGVTVTGERGRIIHAGKGLRHRLITDANLRWIRGLLR